MSDNSPLGGIDPALVDAVHSIKATHEDEFPRGQEPDAATEADDDDAHDRASDGGSADTDPTGTDPTGTDPSIDSTETDSTETDE